MKEELKYRNPYAYKLQDYIKDMRNTRKSVNVTKALFGYLIYLVFYLLMSALGISAIVTIPLAFLFSFFAIDYYLYEWGEIEFSEADSYYSNLFSKYLAEELTKE